MNDREMLELAAKAAGINLRWNHDRYPMDADEDEGWDPLNDDGDALRLAVKLRFCVSVTLDGVSINRGASEPLAWERAGIGSDEIRCGIATRRAIVRAAATIGEET